MDNKDKYNSDNNENKSKKTNYLALGISLGLVFGVALKNIGLGLAVGVALGAGLDSQKKKDK